MRASLGSASILLLLVLPLLGGPATAAAAPVDVQASAAGAPHGTSPTSFTYASSLYDNPGLPYGYPHRDTFGYTVESVNQSRWIDDAGGDVTKGANVLVDMGDFNRLHMTWLHTHYWADVVFDARVRLWSDGDGHFEPNNSYTPPSSSASGGAAPQAPNPCFQMVGQPSAPCIGPDDPCPVGDFPVMDVYAGTTLDPGPLDVLLRTVYGGDMTGCNASSGSEQHAFTIRPDPLRPGEPAGRFHIPKELLGSGGLASKDCFVRLTFVPRDLVLPHEAPGHDDALDGVSINITSVMVQLVAPPLVISHGYSAFPNPPTQTLDNQQHLKDNLRQAMLQHFGQDPWGWASSLPEGGIYLNSYDRKQDFRKSALELDQKVDASFTAYWTGKIWMHGQSMGGLVSRYYIEQLGGAAHVAKHAQTATPNTGSIDAVFATFAQQTYYGQADVSPNTRLGLMVPPMPCIPSLLVGWKPWYTAVPGNVFTYHCGAPHGRSRMADFELRPAGVLNPILSGMNSNFLSLLNAGALPPYFSVRANLEVTPGFDQAVSFASASLNGAIPHRTIKTAHEDTPSQPQTAMYFARFFGNLHLDSGYPKWCMPHETREPHVFPLPPWHPGDGIDFHAGPDHEYTATENMTLETYDWTEGILPFDNGTLTGPPYVLDDEATLVPNRPFKLLVDATDEARITVRSPLDHPPFTLTLEGPNGEPARATYREDTGGWTRVQEFVLTDPIPGTYTVSLGPTAYATPYAITGSWASDHRLVLGTSKVRHDPGEDVVLQARLGDGPSAARTATVVAHVPAEVGYVDLPLLPQGDGSYAALWRPTLGTGLFSVYVTAEGTSAKGPFYRNQTLPVLVDHARTESAASTPADSSSPVATANRALATGLKVGRVERDNVLSWPAQRNVTGFQVWAGSPLTLLATLDGAATGHRDPLAAPGQAYAVTAFDAQEGVLAASDLGAGKVPGLSEGPKATVAGTMGGPAEGPRPANTPFPALPYLALALVVALGIRRRRSA